MRNEDVILWHTFGTIHNPRVEDWHVMPCEKMNVTLRPVNFFERNPGIDVKLSKQEENVSVSWLRTDGAVYLESLSRAARRLKVGFRDWQTFCVGRKLLRLLNRHPFRFPLPWLVGQPAFKVVECRSRVV